jgi:hypothetical protein
MIDPPKAPPAPVARVPTGGLAEDKDKKDKKGKEKAPITMTEVDAKKNRSYIKASTWGAHFDVTMKNAESNVLESVKGAIVHEDDKHWKMAINETAVHFFTPDLENVKVVPRASVAYVEIIDTDSEARDKEVQEEGEQADSMKMMCVRVLLTLLIVGGLGFFFIDGVIQGWFGMIQGDWIEAWPALLGPPIAYAIWKILPLLWKPKRKAGTKVIKVVEKGSRVNLCTPAGTVSFLIADEAWADLQVFLDDPLNGMPMGGFVNKMVVPKKPEPKPDVKKEDKTKDIETAHK